VIEVGEQVDVVRRPGITLETAGYIGLALLAAGLRFYQLGAAPLSAPEAAEAVAAWRQVHAGATPPTPASPLLFGVLAFLFSLFTGSDALARFLPALAGSALVLTPALFRPWLGRGGALLAAALLAVSPSMIYASRLVAPDTLALLCGVVAIAALLGYLRSRATPWLYIGAVALGLGLASGPLIYSLLILAVFGGLALWSQAGDEARTNALAAYQSVRDEPGLLARLGATLAATFVLAATAFMSFPSGLGTAGDVLAAWVAGFSGSRWVGLPLQIMAQYEPMALILGSAGLIAAIIGLRRAAMKDEGEEDEAAATVEVQESENGAGPIVATPPLGSWALVLGAAALAALLIAMLRRGGTPGEVLLVVYPLALLAGPLVAGALEGLRAVRQREAAWGLALALIIMLLASVISLGIYADDVATEPDAAQAKLLVAALLPVAALMLVALAVTWERPLWRVGMVVLVGVLALYSIGMGWGLAQLRPSDPREPWVTQPTSAQVRLLVTALEDASGQRTGMIHEIPVTVQTMGDDVLPWYLRDFENATYTDKLGAEVTTPAVITPDSDQLPELGGAYRGTAFVLRTRRVPEDPNGVDWARWLTIRTGPLVEPAARAVLWIEAPSSER
jgi:uncharacterized protein (TIGR03663 family)